MKMEGAMLYLFNVIFFLRFRVKQEGVWCDLDARSSSVLEVHFPAHDLVVRRHVTSPMMDDEHEPGTDRRMRYQTSAVDRGEIVLTPCSRATAQLLALAVDHIDILLEDWYPTLGKDKNI